MLSALLWSLGIPSARAAPESGGSLTLEGLKAQIANPIQREGKPTIDLHQVTVDLTAENSEFRDRFYRLLQTVLQAGDKALSLDLSNAIIKGTFDLQQLSLREPLYGEAFFPLLSEQEQTQLKRDRKRLSQLSQLSRSFLLQPQPTALGIFLFRGGLNLSQTRFEGPVLGADIFFLETVNMRGAQFLQGVNFSESRFSKTASWIASKFQQEARFRNCLFFQRLRLGQSIFQGSLTFQGSEFHDSASFGQAVFAQDTNFSRATFQRNADFGQTHWQGTGSFFRSAFNADCFLTEARFDASMGFRQARLSQTINLRGAIVQSQLDFGDAVFTSQTSVNVAGLDFNVDQAELLGSPGQIGRVLSVPNLDGNETLLRNLVRNFRKLEQVADANQLEYTTERLRLKGLLQQLTAVNLNTTSQSRLRQVGFSPQQAENILDYRQQTPFVDPADVLDLDEVDLATYVKVRDRIIAVPPRSWMVRSQQLTQYLALAVLLLTSHYGTSVGLTLGGGMVAIALSSLLFWGVDRYRRTLPTAITPPQAETLWMLGSFLVLILLGLTTLMRLGDTPVLTGLAIVLIVVPVPGALIVMLYRQGRFHDQLDTSYLVEDGSARQLRLLIARLPIIPKFPFYRERFYPIDWQRRRNWLNYYDFSLNNWFKFGFNDIRLRDEYVPGLVTALVWYQWAVGLAYVTLLLWTLSRTIPGLNLLLYF